MKLRLSNFIVTDSGSVSRHHPHNTTEMDVCMIVPLDQPLPVIVRGQGCIGLGVVTSITLTPTGTVIKFDLDDSISDNEAKAYYNLYRNQASSSSGGDRYSSADTVIPGAISSLGNNRSVKSSGKKKKHRGSSNGDGCLLDYMDGDYRDY